MERFSCLGTPLAVILMLTFAAACTPQEQAETPSTDDAQATEVYIERMAEQHATDSPTANALTTDPIPPVTTYQARYGTVNGEPVDGYMAIPADADSAAALPGVIVIHEWWGLNDNIRAMTRMLAAQGYRALAVDMYGDSVATTPDRAQELMRQAMNNPQAAQQNLVAAFNFLTDTFGAPEVGAIGWCFGGGMALQAALALPDQLDATVIYYGRLVTDREQLAPLDMPILGIFGAEDEGIPVADVRAFEEALVALDKDATIHVYDGAGHAFANPSGQAFVEDAARDAWQKTTTFLAEHLK